MHKNKISVLVTLIILLPKFMLSNIGAHAQMLENEKFLKKVGAYQCHYDENLEIGVCNRINCHFAKLSEKATPPLSDYYLYHRFVSYGLNVYQNRLNETTAKVKEILTLQKEIINVMPETERIFWQEYCNQAKQEKESSKNNQSN